MTDGLGMAVADGVGTITLNRPSCRNAISRAMWAGLPALIGALGAAPDARVVVISGAGGNFSGGADIAEFDTVYASRAAAADYAALMAGAMAAISACEKPVIAAIEGFCIGGAVGMTLCCDLSFADAAAQFAITPARLGLAYSFADTRRLAARVGAAAAKDLLFSGRRVAAPEALQMRLIDRVSAPGSLPADVAAYAKILSGNSRASIKVAKDFIARAGAGQVAEDAATKTAYLDILEGPDFIEGRRAFAGKVKPKFN
jgi:enoyl-CoA hydratase/carnithine racemase